jgi:hypothetical protein
MKKNILPLIMLIFLTLSYNAFAQEFVFKVLAINGKVLIKRNGSGWSSLKAGDKLFKDDSLDVKDNSYAGLVHLTGRTKELKKPGKYPVIKISKDISADKNNLSERLSNYVLKQLSESDGVLNSDDYHLWLQGTASVERGVEQKISLQFPAKTGLLNNLVSFSWNSESTGDVKFDFYIFDNTGKEIYKESVSTSKILVDLSSLNITQGADYYWNIKLANSSSFKTEKREFYLLNDNEKKAIMDSLALIRKTFDKEESAIDKIVLAAFFSEHVLMVEAMKAYRDALKLAPDVEEYKRLYQLFLYKIKTTE